MPHIHRKKRQEKKRICSDLTNTLKREVTSIKLRNYWIRKDKFSMRHKQLVDWELFGKSMNLSTRARQKWLSKWLSGFCRVGKMLKLTKYQRHDICPRCEKMKEDIKHVVKCPSIMATNLWNKEVNELKTWNIYNGGDPEIYSIITKSLSSWRNDKAIPTIRTQNHQIKTAMLTQDKIG